MSIDLLGPEPLYQQIADVIRQRIKDGTYPPRRAIPSEAGLEEEFSVSRKTVRKAIELLKEEGVLESRMGRGTFVMGSVDGLRSDAE